MKLEKYINPKFLGHIKSWLQTINGRLFIYIVGVPTLLTAAYLYILAPDRYVSISQLSVYDSSLSTQSSTDLFSSLGLTTGQGNTDLQLLQSYLESTEILKRADDILGVKQHYSDSRDFILGLSKKDVFEDFHAFFGKRAYAVINPETGLLNITTEGYSPDFALQLNKFLVSEGERVINELNQNVALSEMEFAEQEVARSLKVLKQEQMALAKFQSEKNLAGPEADGEPIINVIYEMEGLLAQTKAELSETLTYLSPESPQARSLSAKIDALNSQINEQRYRITSSNQGEEALSLIQIEYNDLLFNVELAKLVYETALSSFEISRNQSSKQLKHLIVPSPPSLPEKAVLPEREYWLATMMLIFLALFGIARMIARSIREHQD